MKSQRMRRLLGKDVRESRCCHLEAMQRNRRVGQLQPNTQICRVEFNSLVKSNDERPNDFAYNFADIEGAVRSETLRLSLNNIIRTNN